MRDTMKRLPDSELEVMQAVWACNPPVSSADIKDKIAASYPIAQTTLLTLLTRLTDKGFLKAELDGQRKLFFPLFS